MTYKFIEHRSDVIIEASAKDFLGALENVAEGMFTQMGSEAASIGDEIKIESKAPGKEELIVTFLSDVLAQCEIEPFTPKKIRINTFDEKNNSLTAILSGEKKVPKNIIKVVTYHELKLEENKQGCTIRVLFDI